MRWADALVGVVVPLAGGVLLLLGPAAAAPFSNADVDAEAGTDAGVEGPCGSLSLSTPSCMFAVGSGPDLVSGESAGVAGTGDWDCREDIDTDEEATRRPLQPKNGHGHGHQDPGSSETRKRESKGLLTGSSVGRCRSASAASSSGSAVYGACLVREDFSRS